MSRASNNVSLPSMNSWAPPPVFSDSPHRGQHYSPGKSSHQSNMGRPPPMVMPGRSQNSSPATPPNLHSKEFGSRKRDSIDSRRPSVEEEEAGLALAGMGLGLSAGEMRARRDSMTVNGSPSKRPKVEQKKEKDGKKSCSECRRLKAKCDRVFPCSNCRRRGCALVCPDGDLSCMQGKRLVLASTEQLHERISQLEAALLQAHSQNASNHHPLLAPQNIDGGFASLTPPQDTPPSQAAQDHISPPDQRSSEPSFGLLTPKSNQATPAAGRMALESLLLSEDAAGPEGKKEDEWCGENAAPAMIVGTVGDTPNDDMGERSAVIEHLKTILPVLPPREEAEMRGERFCAESAWYNFMVRREEIFNIYLPAVYSPEPTNPLTPHKLAVVLIMLILDNYFDMTSDEVSDIIGVYWDKVQTCFDPRLGWAASIASVEALGLITHFVGFGWRGVRASNFYWLRLMTSQAQQLGLHKEPHASLSETERELRRRTFWEMYVMDCLISLNHGQRVAIPLEIVETSYPKGTPFDHVRFDYCRTVKYPVLEIGLLPDSRPASPERIKQTLEILMKYDASELPLYHCPSLTTEPLPQKTKDPTAFDMTRLRRIFTSLCHYKALMFLYRPRLRQLITTIRMQADKSYVLTDEDHQTVSMTYLASRSITTLSADVALTHPRIASRCWAAWIQTFSAAVSMAALAIWCGRYLENTFVEASYSELLTGCDMIRNHGERKAQGIISLLPVLKSLVVGRYPQLVGLPADQVKINQEGEDMLYLLLGGTIEQRTSTSSPLITTPTSAKSVDAIPRVPTSTLIASPNCANQLVAPSQAWRGTYLPLGQPPQPQSIWPGTDMSLSTFPPSDNQDQSLTSSELWTKLQNFYEPALTYWQGDLYKSHHLSDLPTR